MFVLAIGKGYPEYWYKNVIRVKSEREKQILYINTYMWNLEKWYRWTYLQSRNRDTDVESNCMDTMGGKSTRMNWEIGTSIYTYYA